MRVDNLFKLYIWNSNFTSNFLVAALDTWPLPSKASAYAWLGSYRLGSYMMNLTRFQKPNVRMYLSLSKYQAVSSFQSFKIIEVKHWFGFSLSTFIRKFTKTPWTIFLVTRANLFNFDRKGQILYNLVSSKFQALFDP